MLRAVQVFMMKAFRRIHFRACMRPSWDSAATTQSFVSQILKLAKRMGKQRTVAQNLVGAVLQSRFFLIEAVGEQRVASGQSASGDFVVGDTAFFVRDIPRSVDFDACLRSSRDGFRVYLLVPEDITQGARLTADSHAPENIAVESIESFVARSVDVSSCFEDEARMAALRTLVEVYNARANASGPEYSTLIAVPHNLSIPRRLQGNLATR